MSKKSKKKLRESHKSKSHSIVKIRNYRLYALRLEGDYYYVGMTSFKDVNKRFQQHVEGICGAKWTKLHKPLEIMEVREIGYCKEGDAARKEALMTREYMHIHGMYRVRGGNLCYMSDKMLAKHFNDEPGVTTKSMRQRNMSRRARKHENAMQTDIAQSLRWIFQE